MLREDEVSIFKAQKEVLRSYLGDTIVSELERIDSQEIY